MPLFFFHLRTGRDLEFDDIGLDLDSSEAAYLEACAAIPGISLDLLRQRGVPGACTFEIRDAQGRLHWEVPFREVLGRLRTLRSLRPYPS